MTNNTLATLEAELAKARLRFSPYFFTIKDRFNQPGAPFFAPAYYISAGGHGGIVPSGPGTKKATVTNAQP
jgi:hypothetical protein